MNQLTTHMNENNVPCSGKNQALTPNRILVIGYSKRALADNDKDWACQVGWQIAAGAVLEKSGPAQAKRRSIYSATQGTRVFL
jgi:hypothetical protein